MPLCPQGDTPGGTTPWYWPFPPAAWGYRKGWLWELRKQKEGAEGRKSAWETWLQHGEKTTAGGF